jgi:hypothetical protein
MSYCGSSVEWKKTIFTTSDSVIDLFKGSPNDWYELPRVKYLDREDIESLGFKCMGGNWYHDNKAYQIIGTWESIEVSRGQHEYRDVLFKGTIKNKSELKRLLKQLNIL